MFLSLFKQLTQRGYSVEVLQLSWAEKDALQKIKSALEKENIVYTSISVNRKLLFNLGVVWAIITAVKTVRNFLQNENAGYLMPRSIIPAFICLLSVRKKNPYILYDSDGFPEDERVEFGKWKINGLAYQFYRTVEFKIFHKATCILTRSQKAKEVISARAGSAFNKNKVEVIWNGRDEKIFNIIAKQQRTLLRQQAGFSNEDIVIIYAGSLGEKYMVKEMLQFFNYMKQTKNAKIIVLTRQHEYFALCAKSQNISIEDFKIKSVSPNQVPEYINMADLGVFFCANTFSTESVFPTKLSEYLLCGLPAAISAGIGDCDEISKNNSGLFALSGYNNNEYEKLATWLSVTKGDELIREKNRRIALENLTVEKMTNKIMDAIKRTESAQNE